MLSIVDGIFLNIFKAEGRIGRGRYLFLEVFLGILFLDAGVFAGLIEQMFPFFGVVIFGLAYIILAAGGICVAIRRLHDFSASGSWAFLAPVPLLGFLLFLALLLRKGTVGPNKYGPDPDPSRPVSACTE